MMGVYITIFPDTDLSRSGIFDAWSATGNQNYMSAADWMHRRQRRVNKAWQHSGHKILITKPMVERIWTRWQAKHTLPANVLSQIERSKPVQLALWIPATGNEDLNPPDDYYPKRIAS